MQDKEPIEGTATRVDPGATSPSPTQPPAVMTRRETLPVAATTPAQLLTLAVQEGADLDRLERLMQMQQAWEKNEARKAYDLDMAAFKAEDITIEKTKRVYFESKRAGADPTDYYHATLSDVTRAVGPALAKHGFAYRWNTRQENGVILVSCVITHKLGHHEQIELHAKPDDSGGKNAIQQVGSAITYLQRYTLLAITGMATTDMDDDGLKSEPPKSIEELYADVPEADRPWVITANKIETPDEYEVQRAAMIKHYGTVNKIPEVVRNAFNAAKAAVMPKDET